MADIEFRQFDSLVHKVAPGVPGCPYPLIVDTIRDIAIDLCERSLAWRFVLTPLPLYSEDPEFGFTSRLPDMDITKAFELTEDGVLYGNGTAITLNEDELYLDTDCVVGKPDQKGVVFPILGGAIDDSGVLYLDVGDDFIAPQPPVDEADAHVILSASITTDGKSYKQLSVMSNEAFFASYSDWPNGATGTPNAITQISIDKFCVAPLPSYEDDAEPVIATLLLALKPKHESKKMPKAVLDDFEDAIVHGVLGKLMMLPSRAWTNEKSAVFHAQRYTYLLNNLRAGANLTSSRALLVASANGYRSHLWV